MSQLVINDLVESKELGRKAMAAVFGGSHGIGNYDRSRYSPWRLTYRRAFVVHVRRGLHRFRAIQYQYTWKRTQNWYRGRLRLIGRA